MLSNSLSPEMFRIAKGRHQEDIAAAARRGSWHPQTEPAGIRNRVGGTLVSIGTWIAASSPTIDSECEPISA